jgi:hypothetical protein
MGLSATKWEADYDGHYIRVSRSEVTRGFEVRVDGNKVGGKMFTLFGLGKIEGAVEMHGNLVPITVELTAGSECNVHVDGKFVKMKQIE